MTTISHEVSSLAVGVEKLRHIYRAAKETAKRLPANLRIDPRGVFCNNALNLKDITVYGFDYDYTLAVYTRAINKLIYDLSVERLIEHFKVSIEPC